MDGAGPTPRDLFAIACHYKQVALEMWPQVKSQVIRAASGTDGARFAFVTDSVSAEANRLGEETCKHADNTSSNINIHEKAIITQADNFAALFNQAKIKLPVIFHQNGWTDQQMREAYRAENISAPHLALIWDKTQQAKNEKNTEILISRSTPEKQVFEPWKFGHTRRCDQIIAEASAPKPAAA